MGGKKGMTWNTDREPPRVKINSAVKPAIKQKIVEVVEDTGQSESRVIEGILEKHFEI